MSGNVTVGRCESPQVSEYRSRLQRTQRTRHSRIQKTKLQVVPPHTQVTHEYHLQRAHRTPQACSPTSLDETNISDYLLSTPTRRRSKSEPRNSTPRRLKRSPPRRRLSPPAEQQQVPLAAECFRSQGYHLDPSQRFQPSPPLAVVSSNISQSPPTLCKTPFPPGTLNSEALAKQRRKLDQLVRLHTGTAAKANNGNVNSASRILASQPGGTNQKPRIQGTGRLGDDGRMMTPPIVLEPHFLATAPSSASTSTEEGPQPLPKSDLQLPSTNSINRNVILDFHAKSGTGFLVNTKATGHHNNKTIPAESAQPQIFNERPMRFSENPLRIPPPSTSHNIHQYPVTVTTKKTTKPKAPPEHPRTIHTRSRSAERRSPSYRDREPQDQSLHRHRSHSVAVVGRPPLCPNPSEKRHENAKYANRNNEHSSGESICDNGNDDDDDDDATPSEFSHFVAHDDATGCGDPCSSSNIRSGIRAGQGVAERLSNCLVVTTPWTSPAEEPTTPRRRSRSSSATSRQRHIRPSSSSRAMDDNDAYFLSERRWRQQQHEEEWDAPRRDPNLSHDSSRTKQRSHHSINRADRFVVHNDNSIVKENVSHISRGASSCDSSWGPVPPPPPVEHEEKEHTPRTSSDRDLIGPPQIILKVRRRLDQHSPTSILQDPFDPPSQHDVQQQNQHQRIEANETTLSALTVSVSPDGYTPPRHSSPNETPTRNIDAKLEFHNSTMSNPYDESSTQRRQQLLLGAMRTRTVEAKPFDELSGTGESLRPQPIRSLLDSTMSSGRHSISMEQQQEKHLRGRVSSNYDPEPRPPLGTSNSLLRDVRLELFRRGRGDKCRSPTPLSENLSPVPKNVSFSDDCSANKLDRLAGRALDRLQQKELGVLQQKLSENEAVLEQTKRELEMSRAETAQRSQLFELASANIFKERMEVEEKLRQEMLSNEQIRKQMQEIQKEVARLGNAIETTEVATASSEDDDRTAQAVERLSADLLSLRSEVIDLRAQLAESQAASLVKDQAMETLRCERDDAQSQLSGLNQQVKQLEREAITLRARATLASVQQDKDLTNRYEERIKNLEGNLEEARRQADDRAETKKVLEQKLAEVQAVTVKYTKEVDDLKQQLEQTQRDADEKVSAGDAETRKLQMELREIKDKLSHTNSEIINQAAAHLKEKGRLQSELEQTRQVAQVLQNKVSNMDQDLAAIQEEKQKIFVGEADRASNISSAPGVIFDLIRKTLDQTRTPSPSE